MGITKQEKAFVNHILDLTQSLGPVHAKHMFGGHGIFLNGLMFALIADSTLYLKADEELTSKFRAKGLDAFTYSKKGKTFKMSYYQAPEESLDDSNEMQEWAGKAYGAAVRSADRKVKKDRSKKRH